MTMYSYDQVLTDVREVYEQLTGLPAPKVDVKKPRFPLPSEVDPVALVQSEINYLNLYLVNSGISSRLSKTPTWTPLAEVYETPDDYVIQLELAGMNKDEVTVQQMNNILVVRGTRRFRRASEEASIIDQSASTAPLRAFSRCRIMSRPTASRPASRTESSRSPSPSSRPRPPQRRAIRERLAPASE